MILDEGKISGVESFVLTDTHSAVIGNAVETEWVVVVVALASDISVAILGHVFAFLTPFSTTGLTSAFASSPFTKDEFDFD